MKTVLFVTSQTRLYCMCRSSAVRLVVQQCSWPRSRTDNDSLY